jgi:hypothetical protein
MVKTLVSTLVVGFLLFEFVEHELFSLSYSGRMMMERIEIS